MARWMLYMDNPYLEVISYVERIHRQFLEVVKLELEGFGIHDINNVQAIIPPVYPTKPPPTKPALGQLDSARMTLRRDLCNS